MNPITRAGNRLAYWWLRRQIGWSAEDCQARSELFRVLATLDGKREPQFAHRLTRQGLAEQVGEWLGTEAANKVRAFDQADMDDLGDKFFDALSETGYWDALRLVVEDELARKPLDFDDDLSVEYNQAALEDEEPELNGT
jgi:hypothetical protein